MIRIGKVEIKGNKILSPMAGISDSPTRRISRSFGSAFAFTEFVSTEQIVIGNPKTIKMFSFAPQERPIFFQVFGNHLETILEASKIAESLNPDILDLNMGCSAQKVSMRGSGAGLLKNLPYAGRILETLVKELSVPVTAKIRVGWDETSLNYKETVHVLQESGVSAISVHGRTKSMGYTGLANWEIIGEIKSFARVPIFGNGDILNWKQAKERIAQTNVDAVLIGRGAIGNPWIFSEIDKDSLSLSEIKSVAFDHLNLMLEFYGQDYGLVLFRKHLSRYFQNLGKEVDLWKTKLLVAKDLDSFFQIYHFENPEIKREESLC